MATFTWQSNLPNNHFDYPYFVLWYSCTFAQDSSRLLLPPGWPQSFFQKVDPLKWNVQLLLLLWNTPDAPEIGLDKVFCTKFEQQRAHWNIMGNSCNGKCFIGKEISRESVVGCVVCGVMGKVKYYLHFALPTYSDSIHRKGNSSSKEQ